MLTSVANCTFKQALSSRFKKTKQQNYLNDASQNISQKRSLFQFWTYIPSSCHPLAQKEPVVNAQKNGKGVWDISN